MLDRWWKAGAAAVGAAAALVLLAVALFPWGWLKPIIEREAGRRLGRAVTIGAVDRLDLIGFHPVVAIRDVRAPQAEWAGGGDLARVRAATVRFAAWPLLIGRLRLEGVRIDGARVALVRDARGRTNWSRPGARSGGGGGADLGDLVVADAVVTYADAKRDRRAAVRVAVDPAGGVRVRGAGAVRGAPVALSVTGPVPRRGAPWPFVARIDGAALAMVARGATDRSLDTGAMSLDVAARASDLRLIDAVIEAGLFGTRPVALRARVRRDPGKWAVRDLKGRVGRSDLAGRITVEKVDGRSKIDGAVTSRGFDFDDLTTPEGRARAAALKARIGPRLVPDTRINLAHLARTDGVLVFKVGRVLGGGSPPVLDMAGTLTMDHGRLTLFPLRLGLAQGRVTGRAVVDQRGGRRSPTLTLDVRLANGEVGPFANGGAFTGRLAARVRLAGTGDTIRVAVGRSRGSIGFVAADGRLPARYAAALGFDAGRALLDGAGERAALRCMVVRLAVRDGVGRAAPLIVDTAISRMSGAGAVSFPDERLDLVLRGAPKRGFLLRIPGEATVGGSIRAPRLSVPPQVRSAGNILKAIADRITGHSGPVARDADCGALAAGALR